MRTVLIPDLDDELVHALAQVEELLLTLSVWEDDPHDAIVLPTPLAGRVALHALERVQDAVGPTQTRSGRPAPVGGRLLGPDGRDEHRPLRLVDLDPADLAVLAAAAAVLGRELATRPHGDLADAVAAGAEAAAPVYGPTPTGVQLVEALARAHGLLDLPDTDDTVLLRARLTQPPALDPITGQPTGQPADIVLTRTEDAAYARLADRMNAIWALANPLDRFTY
jgi:hypothetical protein